MKIRDELRKELARREYASYCEYVHQGMWKRGKAVEYICNQIQAFIEEKTENAYDILVLSMPPQHGKSLTITETLPSYYLMKNPTHRVVEISYSEDFAQLFGRRNRQKIKEFGGVLFGTELADTPNSNTEFELSNNIGGMISRGVMSGVTGRPCNLMIIDDPIKNMQEADSPTYRERIKAEWNASFKTRFASGAKVILIQTRWHEDDLAGYIIKNEKNVRVVNLPCEAEDNDPLGREKGQALAPEIGKGDKWLQSFKEGFITTEGQRTWLALFQGKPTAQEGNLIKRTWWRYYKKEELPQMPVLALSIDATFKDKDTNDYVAIQVWGKRNNSYYLIDRVKERLDFISTITAIQRMLAKHPRITYKYIEDKANGSAIISVLRNKIDGIIAVEPEGGKVARANAVSYLIESGNVFLPQDEPWIEEFVDEWSKFPNAEHDDEVDCGTQALNKLRRVGADAPNDINKVFNFSFEKPQPNPIGKGNRQSVI
jgi:predicted phage terminase large subunit-like protein